MYPTTATVSLQLNTSALAIYILPEKVIMEARGGLLCRATGTAPVHPLNHVIIQ
jgi:hypothetical protein